jgi:small subunit ribosomal protein S8
MTDPIADLLTRIRNAIQARHGNLVVPRSVLKLAIVRILKDEGYIEGRRVYVGKADIPQVRNGLGVAILTTPKGVITDRQARRAGVGGEVLCYVW